jgi:hypothetical protein
MGAPKGHAAYNVNGEGGRPVKYTDEFLDELANQLDTWINNEKNLWIKNFFTDRYIPVQIPEELCSRSKRFSEAYARAKILQESRIYNRALERKYDGTMARFGLMNNHGWAEKSKTEISGDANNPLNVLFNHSKELVNSNEQPE